MSKNLKVILTGEGSEFGKNCANVLRTYGCDVNLVAKDGRTLLSKYESCTRADAIVSFIGAATSLTLYPLL